MNLYLVGNGFDLAHNLPTKYENFLHTINFLIHNYNSDMLTIGSILGSPQLHSVDGWIYKCYQHYGAGWNEAMLKNSEVDNLINIAKKNMWFAYLTETFDQDLGWIDFEKEISFVIDSFSEFLAINTDRSFAIERKIDDERIRYIISKFEYFHDRYNTEGKLPVWERMEKREEGTNYMWMEEEKNINWGISGLKKKD